MVPVLSSTSLPMKVTGACNSFPPASCTCTVAVNPPDCICACIRGTSLCGSENETLIGWICVIVTSGVVTITQIQPIKVSFSLPQSDVPRIQAQMQSGGLTATVQVHDAGGKELHAPVTFIGNEVDDKTGTIELRATYDNGDNALVPGQLVDVKVALKDIPKAIVVPHDAINVGPDNRFVYVITKENKADMRTVDVLYDDGIHAAISGKVKAGDRVVTEGQLRLVPGREVTIAKQRAKGATPRT